LGETAFRRVSIAVIGKFQFASHVDGLPIFGCRVKTDFLSRRDRIFSQTIR